MRKDGVRMGGPREKGTTGYAYNHKQYNRKYKYSEQEIAWIRDATIPDIASKYNIPESRAKQMRGGFRNGYRWLPWPNKPINTK